MEPSADLSWRLIVDEPARGSRNMALDHALARALPPGEGVLRLYGWERPTVSLGRNEPTRGVYDVDRAAERGITFVRRPTGGRAVLHDDEVTYAVAVPLGWFGGLRDAYRLINEGLVTGLRALGVDATLAAGEAMPSLESGPCFQVPAPGEVVADSGKLVGSAQARVGDAVLQHGSILLRGDQAALYELTGDARDPAPPATLAALGGESEPSAVMAALADGIRLALGGAWTEGEYRAPEVEEADRLEWGRYASPEWTWRR